jgi:DNA-binding SARP family transcriptional activator/TolB-like protein
VFTLRTLGSLELFNPDGEPITSVLAQPKRAALLVYLAAATPRGFHRRDTLAALFWPEDDDSHARSSLRVALHFLRQSLGPEVGVVRGGEEIAVDGEQLWCDAAGLEEAVAKGQLAEAVELYRGPFLDGFHLSGTPRFERWVEETRRRLRKSVQETTGSLAQRDEEAGDLEGAASWAARALELAPYDESALRRLLHLLDLTGNRAGALQAYERFAARIETELGAAPSPETEKLLETIRARGEPSGFVEIPVSDRAAPGGKGSGPVPERREAEPGATALRGERPRWSRRRLAAAATIALIATGALITLWVSNRGAPQWGNERALDPAIEVVPERVLVVPFENLSGSSELDPLGAITADWITQGLAQTGLLEVISARSALQMPLVDAAAGLQDERLRSRALLQLAEQTHAGTIVWGSYSAAGDSFYLNARVSNAHSGTLIGGVPQVIASTALPLDGVEELRQRVVGLLAAHFDERLAFWAEAASTPPRHEAYLAYARGVGAETREERIREYRRAYSLDSLFVTPLIQALILVNDPEEPRFDTLLSILERSKERLTPADRLQVDGIRAFVDGDRPAFYRAAIQAAELSPDRLVDAGTAAYAAGMYRQAAEIWGRRDLPRAWRFPWSTYVHVLHGLGEHERALEVARQAQQEQPGDLSRVYFETGTLAALGRVQELREAVEAALKLPTSAGTSRGAFLFWTGAEALWHGQAAVGRELLERSLPFQEAEVEQEPESEWLRIRLARTLLYLDRPDEALEVIEGIFPESLVRSASTSNEFSAFELRGVAAALSGDSINVRRVSAILRETEWEDKYAPAHALASQAKIAAALRDCDEAVRLQTQAADFALLVWGNPHWRDVHHHSPAFLRCRDHPAVVALDALD